MRNLIFISQRKRRSNAGQQIILERLEMLAAGQEKLLRSAKLQLSRARPSVAAWIVSVSLLLISGFFITLSTDLLLKESSIDSAATTLHQDGEALRGIAINLLIQGEQPSQIYFSNDLTSSNPITPKMRSQLQEALQSEVATGKAVNNYMNQAEGEDAEADKEQSSADVDQLFAQVTLGVSSALFGAIFGWIISTILSEIFWRRESAS